MHLSEEHRANLAKLADFLDKVDSSKFSMDAFVQNYDPSSGLPGLKIEALNLASEYAEAA